MMYTRFPPARLFFTERENIEDANEGAALRSVVPTICASPFTLPTLALFGAESIVKIIVDAAFSGSQHINPFEGGGLTEREIKREGAALLADKHGQDRGVDSPRASGEEGQQRVRRERENQRAEPADEDAPRTEVSDYPPAKEDLNKCVA